MEPVIYLAKAAAVLYLCVGLGALINKNYFKRVLEDFCKSPGAMYLGSISALLFGFGLLYVHSAWTTDWQIIITILGWGAIIKGAAGLLFPEYFIKFSEKLIRIKDVQIYAGISCLVLGCIFGYFGFWA